MERRVRTGVIVLLCLALLLNGGCTAALWRNVNPNKPLWVPSSEVTEEQLQARGVKYTKTRIMRPEPVEGYEVEKTGPQKLCDCAVLAVATPVTVAADVALTAVCIAVIGGLLVAAAAAASEQPWPWGF